jgi:hypothetical protein
MCCRYVSVEIQKPKGRGSIDQARWLVSHRDVWIYVDDKDNWYAQFVTPCEQLDLATQMCGIYEDRFQICRDYKVRDCEATLGSGTEHRLFRTLQELDRHLGIESPSTCAKKVGGGPWSVEV